MSEVHVFSKTGVNLVQFHKATLTTEMSPIDTSYGPPWYDKANAVDNNDYTSSSVFAFQWGARRPPTACPAAGCPAHS
jgi:hypothetical protein